MVKKEKSILGLNFWANFKFKVKNNFKIMIILAILHFVAAPLNLINLLVYLGKQNSPANVNNQYDFNVLYPIIGVLSTIAALFCGFIVVFNVFNYLYKKQNVDMVLALPMSSKTRFWSDFSAGLFVYIAPFIANSVLTIILSVVGEIFVKGWSTTYAFGDEIMNMPGVINNVTLLLLALIVGGILIMLSIYCFTLLVTVCCGSMFESVAYSIMVMGLIPATIAMFTYIFFEGLYGVLSPLGIFLPLLKYSSPGGNIVALVDWVQYRNIGAFFIFIAISLLVSAALAFVSYILYKKRKAEHVSKPFVYKAFYYVIITCVTFCVGSLFVMDLYFGIDTIFEMVMSRLIPLIIVTGILYLIIEIITNRGFKKFGKSVIKYLITISAVIFGIILCRVTGGFGIEKYIPSETSIKSVELAGNGLGAKIDDQETINKVVSLHEKIIKDYDENYEHTIFGYNGRNNVPTTEIEHNTFSTSTISVYIKYSMKNGTTISRNYNIYQNLFSELLNIEHDINFAIGQAENVLSLGVHENRRDNISFAVYDYKSYVINDRSANSAVVIDSKNDKNYKEKSNKLIDCLTEDIKAQNIDGKFAPSGTPVYALNSVNDWRNPIYIYDNYVNTLQFLKDNGIKVNFDDTHINVSNASMYIVEPQFLEYELNGEKKYSTLLNSSNCYNRYDNAFIYDIINIDIIKKLQPIKTSNEPFLGIMINDSLYAIPNEYNYLLNEALQKYHGEYQKEISAINNMYGYGDQQIGGEIHTYSGNIFGFYDKNSFAEVVTQIYNASEYRDSINEIRFSNGESKNIADIDGGYFTVKSGNRINFQNFESFAKEYDLLYNNDEIVESIYFTLADKTIKYNDGISTCDYDRFYFRYTQIYSYATDMPVNTEAIGYAA